MYSVDKLIELGKSCMGCTESLYCGHVSCHCMHVFVDIEMLCAK